MAGVKGDGGSLFQAEMSKFSFEVIDIISKQVNIFHDGRIANGEADARKCSLPCTCLPSACIESVQQSQHFQLASDGDRVAYLGVAR